MTWCCVPAPLLTHGKSAFPAYAPSIWRMTCPRSGWPASRARSGCPTGSGYVQLESADPKVQPTFNYCYLQHPNDIRRVRDGLRLALRLLESDAYKDVVDRRLTAHR